MFVINALTDFARLLLQYLKLVVVLMRQSIPHQNDIEDPPLNLVFYLAPKIQIILILTRLNRPLSYTKKSADQFNLRLLSLS